MLISKKIIWSEKILERYLNTLRNPTHGGRREAPIGRGVAQGDWHSAWKNQLNFVFEICCCLKKLTITWTGSLSIWTKESQDPWHCSKVRNSKDGSGFLSRISCRSKIRAQKHYYGATSSYNDGILDLEELISEWVDQLQVDYPQARWAEQLAEHPLCYTSPPKHH